MTDADSARDLARIAAAAPVVLYALPALISDAEDVVAFNRQ